MPKYRYIRRPRVWQTEDVLTDHSRIFTYSGNIPSKGVDSRCKHRSDTSPIKMDAQKFVEQKSLAMEETTTLDDEALLARLGYKQEFKRDFSRCLKCNLMTIASDLISG